MAVIKYLGHAAFDVKLVGLDGREKRVLIDPWLENPLSPVKVADYRGVRVDYIVVTHDHGDHLGNAAELASLTKGVVVGVYEVAEKLREQGAEAIGGNVGGALSVDDLLIVLTPALHSSSSGVPTGVVVGGSEARVYHAGDTGLFSDMALIGELYSPDIALLPIGGHFTMGVKEAVKAVQLLRPRVAVPMHYNTFPPIRADPGEFKRLVEALTPAKAALLKPGDLLTYPA